MRVSKLANNRGSSYSCRLLRSLHPGGAIVFDLLVQAGGIGNPGGHILFDDGRGRQYEWTNRLRNTNSP